MELMFDKDMYAACQRVLRKPPFNMNKSLDRDWYGKEGFDLRRIAPAALRELRDALDAAQSIKGTKTMVRDIDIWLKASTESGLATTTARNVRSGMALVIEYLRRNPRRQVYRREQDGIETVMLCYYVEEIKFVNRVTRDGYTTPEHFIVDLWYEEFDDIESTSVVFWPDDVLRKNAYSILIGKGLYPETEELRADYEECRDKWGKWHQQIGKQFLAVGVVDDKGIDGNDEDAYNRRYWYTPEKIVLDKDGTSARVVIDVFQEEEKEKKRSSKQARPNAFFWSKNTYNEKDEEEADEETLEITDESQPVQELEIPLHPYCAIFDLKRHKRFRIHVGNLTPYNYDVEIRSKLILPENITKLLDTLLSEAATQFKDVVKGKTGGIIVLCQGPPGTGKTLTSEIYSEICERALYTVQCSQLGTDPEELEKNLLKTLARGRRWGAVMLLDEADVYVHKRGTDLTQNAIIGVFLRVLEYQTGTLFLTTNRGDTVDDAILSRCTARISYTVPSEHDQIMIWRVISDANDIDLNLPTIKEIVKRNENISGRDVKNLLKLASMMAHKWGGKIDADLIDQVKVFKPTTE